MELSFKLLFCSILICLTSKGSHAVDSLRFLIIGDMGGVDYAPYSTYYERSTAAEMGKIADLYSPQFVMELGDNFYYDGVKDVNDFRFQATFEDVYTAKSLQIPWYFIAGNHDHHGNVTAQILYTQRSNRWKFQDYYYYLEFPFADGQHSVGFVMVDTVLLCGSTDDFVAMQPQGPENKKKADEQWAFIENSLKKSRADYLFTAGHYPVYSIAEHGPTDCLVKQLNPMLDTYKANGHLSGHDHNLQHLHVKSEQGNNLDYFVSGMANFVDFSTIHNSSVPIDSLKFHYGNIASKGGFLYAETTTSNMTLTFITADGVQLYTTTLWPRKV
ncbi:tartrate-resistant acid phosphatase type 5-like isoform X1 [Physella acuta]|uniref:tartrate-resistant acid phosphatase type 5-like isoform X1 n=1 Tax=Physella acuta TaxID=109671 RepID=UPI0027DD1D3F|nr:tartrate-resistant acid phosphatase type 5-like isoform X1 [Physella acuta]